MAKKRGIVRRIIDKIIRREAPKPIPPAKRPKSLRQKAIENFINQIPLANIDSVTNHVSYMDIDELEWTANATSRQLVNAARQDADRLTVDQLPLNPWWYH